MIMIMNVRAITFIVCFGAMLTACTYGSVLTQNNSDSMLEERIVIALESASDLPANAITVEAREGIVILTGSVVCDSCGGARTPAGVRTVQQSLGSVVRAVPGVERVEFDIQYQLPAELPGG